MENTRYEVKKVWKEISLSPCGASGTWHWRTTAHSGIYSMTPIAKYAQKKNLSECNWLIKTSQSGIQTSKQTIRFQFKSRHHSHPTRQIFAQWKCFPNAEWCRMAHNQTGNLYCACQNYMICCNKKFNGTNSLAPGNCAIITHIMRWNTSVPAMNCLIIPAFTHHLTCFIHWFDRAKVLVFVAWILIKTWTSTFSTLTFSTFGFHHPAWSR